MAEPATPYDWDSVLSGTSAPVSAAEGQNYDWDKHLTTVTSPGDTVQPETPQYTGVLREPLLAAKALGSGVMNLLDLPGDVLDAALGPVKPGPTPPIAGLTLSPPSSTTAVPLTNVLGLTSTPQLTPQTPGEKYGSTAVGAIPAALAGAATGGGTLAGNLAASEGGGLVGEAVHDLFPNSKWGPVVAGVFTGLGVGGVENSIVRSTAAKLALKRVADSHAALEAAQDGLFYGGHTAGTAATDVKALSAAHLGEVKSAAQIAQEAAAASHKELLDSTAAGLGESTTLQQAGEKLQDSARTWINETLPSKLDEVWEPVNAAIPADHQLELGQFGQTLAKINKGAGRLEPLAALMKPGLPAKFKNLLDKQGELEGLASDAEAAPQSYSWKDVQAFRSNLGEAMGNPQVIKDVGAKNLSRLYAALTMDMRVGADRAGAVPLFDAANAESTRLYNIAEGPVARVVASGRPSAEDRLPETVAAGLLTGGKKGATDLEVLRSEMPEAVNELAAAHLRQPGAWEKLSPEAKQALVPDTGAAGQLEASLAAQDAARLNAKQTVAAAVNRHAETVSATNAGVKEGNFKRAEAVRLAQKERALAEASLPEASTPVTNLTHTVQSGLAGVVGHDLTPYVLNHLQINPNPVVTAGMTAAGLALPYAVRGAKAVIKNPGNLRLPLIAGAAANNPLSLSPPAKNQ